MKTIIAIILLLAVCCAIAAPLRAKRAKKKSPYAAAVVTHGGGGIFCVSRPKSSASLDFIWLYVGPSPTDTPEMFGVDPFEGEPTCIDTQITDGRWARVRLGTDHGPVTDFSNAIQFGNF